MKIDVRHIAKLANLPLTDNEIKLFEKQLADTIKYIEVLNKIDTKNIAPTSQVTGLENVLRDDIPSPSLSQTEALSNTKNQSNGFFKVKNILNHE
jgi:aspartyl-tRNA(Asn)/glutamyl-tRNA(Gln) amidotransferase subunit C